ESRRRAPSLPLTTSNLDVSVTPTSALLARRGRGLIRAARTTCGALRLVHRRGQAAPLDRRAQVSPRTVRVDQSRRRHPRPSRTCSTCGADELGGDTGVCLCIYRYSTRGLSVKLGRGSKLVRWSRVGSPQPTTYTLTRTGGRTMRVIEERG